MVNVAKIKQILDTELKPEELGENFKEINENAIIFFQKLFVENLNFDLVRGQFGEIGEQISTDDWSRDAEAEKAFIIAEKEEFRIIYIVVKNLTITRERQSIASLKRKRWAKKGEYICIFFAENSLIWDMVCPHFSEEKMILRRYILGDGENHRTISENLNRMDASDPHPLFERVQQAFKVQVVTKAFFEDYKEAFFTLKYELADQKIPKREAHEFTLQLLNRIMFIYFISKKENWLNTKNFIGWLWTEYKRRKKYSSNEFYEIWLKQIFFKAFNNKAYEIKDLPKEIIDEILSFPYLNGGLFTVNDLDDLKINITDDLFSKIFNFFENYNFTIREDSPTDEEVAVDPRMIGYVYESLANVAEEIYDRHDLGIFYTPRVEVDFMARRVLVEHLSNKFPKIKKEKLYHLVFDTPEEKRNISKYFEDEKFWYNLEEILDNLSVVDPACGSGAFLVGMLNVLVELYKLINKHIKVKRDITDFSLKKRIIQYSLYGVDIMRWAIHAAELRLWLQLMVETELNKEELRQYPLLPNLDLNLRIGDSLVQEIGGISFHQRTSNIDADSKRRLLQLKEEKRNYFDNSPRAKFKSPDEIREEEIRIFEGIIEKRINKVMEELNSKKSEIRGAKKQKELLTNKRVYDKEKIEELKPKIKELNKEIKDLEEIKNVLDKPEKKLFIWDIDFAEIFGDKNGFDIVIGNPPYVSQLEIAPFNKIKSEITTEDKKVYKKKLINSVENQFPVIKKIDAKSDYYIYFYFHGLSLLNENGSFCFITSNSWLDIGYGKELREFLIKFTPIIAIYDNPKRTFEHASINTVIVLFNTPKFKEKIIAGLKVEQKRNWTMLKQTAKFIMFKKPYEELITANNLIEIENASIQIRGNEIPELVNNIIENEFFRVFPIIQEDLLQIDWKYPESYDINRGKYLEGSYDGYNWGGRFLRAPEIYYTIFKKGRDKIVKFGKIAEIKRGITSGSNEFFYLDRKALEKWDIEQEFLKPLVKSPRECKSLIINPNDLKYKVFICSKSKKELKGTNALKYIEWGENVEIQIKQGTKKGETIKGFPNIVSLKEKRRWYDLGSRTFPDAIWIKSVHDNHGQSILNKSFLTDQRLYEIYFNNEIDEKVKALLLNNSVFYLFKEIIGRVNLGDGVLDTAVFEAKKSYCFKPSLFDKKDIDIDIDTHSFKPIFEELRIDPSKPIKEQTPDPIRERYELDKMIFETLNFTETEKNEIYWALCELVNQRLKKAKSLKS